MYSVRILGLGMLAAFGMSAAVGSASAQGQLSVYCCVQVEWCQAIATNFQRETGITVNMTQNGSGETLAQIRAEALNPRGDIWFEGLATALDIGGGSLFCVAPEATTLRKVGEVMGLIFDVSGVFAVRG